MEDLKIVNADNLLYTSLDETEFIIEDILPIGLHIFCGAPKVGKSWLMLDICIKVSKGEEIWNLKTNKCDVLYLALEDTYQRLQKRLFKLTNEIDSNFHISIESNKIANGLTSQLEQTLKKYPDIKLIVIDTLQKVRKQNNDINYSNDYTDISLLKQFADKNKIAVILVHHLRKQDDSDVFNRISGTTGIMGSSDTTFILEKKSRDDSVATLFVTGRDVEYQTFTLRFEECRWNLLERSFQKVRNGEIRVLLGSTQKMGAGTNVQKKLIAMHDLDCPWRPADLTQRLGRIQRQGNENDEVKVIRYVTEQTFDAYLYQLVEGKQKFISQIMTSRTPVRSAEDIDESVLNYAEIKALAVGNPHIIEKTQLEADISKLKIVKQSYWNEIYDIQDKIATYYPAEIKRLQNRIVGLEKDIKQAEEQTKLNDDGFSPMKINDIVYYKKADAGERLIAECQTMTNTDSRYLGTYRGFDIVLSFDGIFNKFTLQLKNELSYNVELGDDKFGNIMRIDNTIQNLSKVLEKEKNELENTNKQFEDAKIESQKEFSKENELKELESKLREVNKLLKIDEKGENVIEDFEDEEQEEKSQDYDKEPIR